MSNVEAIKAAIATLPSAEYVQLRQWFHDKDWERWDRQLEADSQSGKLDFLLAEAAREKAAGTLQEL